MTDPLTIALWKATTHYRSAAWPQGMAAGELLPGLTDQQAEAINADRPGTVVQAQMQVKPAGVAK